MQAKDGVDFQAEPARGGAQRVPLSVKRVDHPRFVGVERAQCKRDLFGIFQFPERVGRRGRDRIKRPVTLFEGGCRRSRKLRESVLDIVCRVTLHPVIAGNPFFWFETAESFRNPFQSRREEFVLLAEHEVLFADMPPNVRINRLMSFGNVG